MRVVIVDSPGLQEYELLPVTRGAALRAHLDLLGIENRLHRVTSLDELDRVWNEERKAPIFHLEAHGSAAGVRLTNGETLPWDKALDLSIRNGSRRVVAFSACESTSGLGEELRAREDELVPLLRSLSKGKRLVQPPRAFLTMFERVKIGDLSLSWSVFYRSLKVERPDEPPTARQIFTALTRVQGAMLPKICAHYWYEKYQRYAPITPWKEERVEAIEQGEPID